MRARERKKSENDVILVTYSMLAERYSIGLNTAQKLAKDSGAVRRIGRSCRVDVTVCDEFVRTLEDN